MPKRARGLPLAVVRATRNGEVLAEHNCWTPIEIAESENRLREAYKDAVVETKPYELKGE